MAQSAKSWCLLDIVGTDFRLTMRSQPILFNIDNNMLTQDGCKQSVERLPNSSVVDRIRPVTLLEDRGEKERARPHLGILTPRSKPAFRIYIALKGRASTWSLMMLPPHQPPPGRNT